MSDNKYSIEPIIHQKIQDTLGVRTSKVYVAVNNIITQFSLVDEEDGYRFYNRKSPATLDDILKTSPILNMVRKEIHNIEFDPTLNIVNFLTDDYVLLVNAVEKNIDIMSVRSLITGEKTNPNQYALTIGEMQKQYISTMCMEIYSYLKFIEDTQRGARIYKMMREFVPLYPLKQKYENFYNTYGGILPNNFSPLINYAKEFLDPKDVTYWVTYQELAEYFQIDGLRIDAASLFYVYSALTNNLLLYVYQGENKEVPPILGEPEYRKLIEVVPDLSTHFRQSTLLDMYLASLNSKASKKGYTRLDRKLLRQMGVV